MITAPLVDGNAQCAPPCGMTPRAYRAVAGRDSLADYLGTGGRLRAQGRYPTTRKAILPAPASGSHCSQLRGAIGGTALEVTSLASANISQEEPPRAI
jgi:hypothetical protein